MKKDNVHGRRNFLKVAAAGTAAIALNPGSSKALSASDLTPGPGNKWPGRAVINFNDSLVSGNEIDVDTNIKMIDQSIKLLTEIDNLGAAWKEVFPDTLSAESKIAIKIVAYNPFKSGLHWSCAKAVSDGLLQMDFDGTKIPAENITIYEMNTSGVSNAFNLAGYTSDNFTSGVKTESAKNPVDGGDGALNNRMYAKTLQEADFLINCFNARGHQLGDSDGRFTLGFKSHFGTYDNPMGMHTGLSKNIRELVCTGPVFQKQVLCICDSPFGTNEGNGPGGISQSDTLPPDDFSTYVKQIDSASSADNPCTVIMSTDPVTVEMQAIKLIRMNKEKDYGPSDLPAYVQAAAGVDKSDFSPTYNVGIIEESGMTIYRIVNDEIIDGPTTGAHPRLSTKHRELPSGFSARPISGGATVFIEFSLPQSYIGINATINIYSIQGTLKQHLSRKVSGISNQLSWNVRDRNGKRVPAGKYIARLTCGGVIQSAGFTIV